MAASTIFKTPQQQEQESQLPPLPPPPPPPPPLPQNSRLSEDNYGLITTSLVKPNMKMRTLNWHKIPKKRVLNQEINKNPTSQDVKIVNNSPSTSRSVKPLTRQQVRKQQQPNFIVENSDDSDDDTKNVWLLIAKANKKSLEKEKLTNDDDKTPKSTISSSSSTNSSSSNKSCRNQSSSIPVSKSSSKIKEMLVSVRRRMAQSSKISSFEQERQQTILESPLKNQQHLVCNNNKQNNCTLLDFIDFKDLENLFCLNSQPIDLNDSDSSNSNFVRRSSMRTNASSDSVISSNSYINDSSNDDELSFELPENILDSKKSLNVNIFLKQLKCTQQKFIDQINHEDHGGIGKEKLENLLKLLPDDNERAHLMKFKSLKQSFQQHNKQFKLPIAEKFLLQLLLEVPNLKLKIKFMLLQEEYQTDLLAIGPELDKIDEASKEIRKSKMFRDVLNLILITGNFLNTGGYAADAIGFSLDCLSRLNEVRSNKPGMSLIHYLANLANQMKIIDFLQLELEHVEPASKVSIELIQADITMMMNKIDDLRNETDKELASLKFDEQGKRLSLSSQSCLFLMNLTRTLNRIKSDVDCLNRRTTCDLEETRKKLANYLCEDQETFKLHDCFHYILSFSQKLKTALEENLRRIKYESQQTRNSCSLRRSKTINSRQFVGRQSLGGEQFMKYKQQEQQNQQLLTSGFSMLSINNDNLERRQTMHLGLSLETDDLHDGLMKLLENTSSRRKKKILW